MFIPIIVTVTSQVKTRTRFTDKGDWQTKTYLEETAGRDPRLAQTVMCPGYIQKGATAVTACGFTSHTGYQPIKFVPEASKCISSSDDVDWALLRAAEVYLNFAEAKAELAALGKVTLEQADLDKSINKIRKRARMPDLKMQGLTACQYMESCYPNVEKGSLKAVILEIRRERTIELALEQPDRSWDMFRWKEAKQCLQVVQPWYGVYIPGLGKYDTSGDGVADIEFIQEGTAVKLKVGSSVSEVTLSAGTSGYIVAYSATSYGTDWNDARDYLWPIPASQRELNPNLKQNPGYVDGIN